MQNENILALILAAGRSTRMGAFKPLLPLDGRTLLEKIIEAYRLAGISRMLVVLGHRSAEVKGLLDKGKIDWVVNEKYDQGMFSSVLTGVKHLRPDCKAFFLHPADIPLVRPETLTGLSAAMTEKKPLICYPFHNGRRGHPPLISAKLIPDILAFDEPGGLRALLSRHQPNALHIECPDQGILMNLNTPEDYAKIAQYVSH